MTIINFFNYGGTGNSILNIESVGSKHTFLLTTDTMYTYNGVVHTVTEPTALTIYPNSHENIRIVLGKGNINQNIRNIVELNEKKTITQRLEKNRWVKRKIYVSHSESQQVFYTSYVYEFTLMGTDANYSTHMQYEYHTSPECNRISILSTSYNFVYLIINVEDDEQPPEN